MNIVVEYSIGDEVTWRYAQNSNREEKCSFCGGAKEVQGADHTVLPCPKCHGKGTTPVPEYREGRSIITGIIVNYDSSYNDAPIINYRTDSGSIKQDDITGKVSVVVEM